MPAERFGQTDPHGASPQASAAYRAAIDAAGGQGGVCDWAKAQEALLQAADLGHGLAESQWAILEALGGLRPDLWPRPEPVVLCRNPVILKLPALLPMPLCDWLIRRGRSLIKPAQVFDDATGSGRSDASRTNGSAALSGDATDLIVAITRFLVSRESGVPLVGLEPTQILHYAPGQLFDWHVDYLDPDVPGFLSDIKRRGQRIATCLFYLNGDFQGGETAFAVGDIRHRGGVGDALLWSNVLEDGSIDRQTVHAGLPPAVGEKWVLSQWVRDRATLA